MEIKLQKQSFINEIRQRFQMSEPQILKKTTPPNSTEKFTKNYRTNIVIEGQVDVNSIDKICKREGISISTFNSWTQEFLRDSKTESIEKTAPQVELSQDDKFEIVLEGKSGVTSIAEICRRESIDHDQFLEWSQEFLKYRNGSLVEYNGSSSVYLRNKLLVEKNSSSKVFSYLENYIDFALDENLIVQKENSAKLDRPESFANLVYLNRINDVRYINKFFEKVNSRMEKGSLFIGCLETFSARKSRKAVNKIPVFNHLYFGLEFFFKRIIPKLSMTKKYYFDITKGSDRLLSKAEGLGRLVSCGFKIMDFKSIDGKLYFVVKKVGEPVFDMSPSYGPLYKMNRLGKNGKIIGVYKFRTMHPYSEYLQDYIVKANGYAETGKPAEDFRIPAWGKFMRRFWLDELPQLINVLKGELKLVGIRPVSQRYFQDIPKEMQKLRLTQKPGCIPPYVSLNRAGNVMSVLQAEKDYLEEKISKPYFTDTKYFFSAIFNIIFKHKRSA